MRRSLSVFLLGVISQSLIRITDGKRADFHEILFTTENCKYYIRRGALDVVEEIMEHSVSMA